MICKSVIRTGLIGAAVVLSGCSATEHFSDTYFVQPDDSGRIATDLGKRAVTYTEQDADGNGYAFKIGNTSSDLVAVTGVIPGTHPGPKVTTGKASYVGTFVVGGFQDVAIKGLGLQQNPMGDAGVLKLSADFDNATLKGGGRGMNATEAKALFGDDLDTSILRSGYLVVDGTIAGKTIGGTVSYEGTQGDLKGVIGADLAVGTFHGKGNKIVYAGGFYTGTDPIEVAKGLCSSADKCKNGLPKDLLPAGAAISGVKLP